LRRLEPVVGVEGEPGDLDTHRGVQRELAVAVRALVLVQPVFVALSGLFGAHGEPTVAAATCSASTLAATSWTRKIRAPRSYAITFAALVATARSGSDLPVMRPRKVLREVPITSGRPIATISSRRRINSRLCSTVFPKPIPGSSQTCSS